MEWEVTAFAGDDVEGIGLWLRSSQHVSVSGHSLMDFMIWPTAVDEEGRREKWALKLSLRDGEDVVAEDTFTYDSLTEATTDAEAMAAYLQTTTDTPHIRPNSVPTQTPTVRAIHLAG